MTILFNASSGFSLLCTYQSPAWRGAGMMASVLRFTFWKMVTWR